MHENLEKSVAIVKTVPSVFCIASRGWAITIEFNSLETMLVVMKKWNQGTVSLRKRMAAKSLNSIASVSKETRTSILKVRVSLFFFLPCFIIMGLIYRTKRLLTWSFCLIPFINGVFAEILNSTIANNRKKRNIGYIDCKLKIVLFNAYLPWRHCSWREQWSSEKPLAVSKRKRKRQHARPTPTPRVSGGGGGFELKHFCFVS